MSAEAAKTKWKKESAKTTGRIFFAFVCQLELQPSSAGADPGPGFLKRGGGVGGPLL